MSRARFPNSAVGGKGALWLRDPGQALDDLDEDTHTALMDDIFLGPDAEEEFVSVCSGWVPFRLRHYFDKKLPEVVMVDTETVLGDETVNLAAGEPGGYQAPEVCADFVAHPKEAGGTAFSVISDVVGTACGVVHATPVVAIDANSAPADHDRLYSKTNPQLVASGPDKPVVPAIKVTGDTTFWVGLLGGQYGVLGHHPGEVAAAVLAIWGSDGVALGPTVRPAVISGGRRIMTGLPFDVLGRVAFGLRPDPVPDGKGGFTWGCPLKYDELVRETWVPTTGIAPTKDPDIVSDWETEDWLWGSFRDPGLRAQ